MLRFLPKLRVVKCCKKTRKNLNILNHSVMRRTPTFFLIFPPLLIMLVASRALFSPASKAARYWHWKMQQRLNVCESERGAFSSSCWRAAAMHGALSVPCFKHESWNNNNKKPMWHQMQRKTYSSLFHPQNHFVCFRVGFRPPLITRRVFVWFCCCLNSQ